MNLMEQQSALKGLSDEQLKQMLGDQSQVPDFLIMGEVNQRDKMREEKRNDNMPPIGGTVKDDMMRNSGGIMNLPPQAGQAPSMRQVPRVAQPQTFADGGAVRGNYNVPAPGLTGWQKIGRGIGSAARSIWDNNTLSPLGLLPGSTQGVHDWLWNPEAPAQPRPSNVFSDVAPSGNVEHSIPGTPGGQMAPGGFELMQQPEQADPGPDPYDMSGLTGRLAGIEGLMAQGPSSPDGGWGDYIAATREQNAVNNAQNQGLALAKAGFSIAGGKDPSALTNFANVDATGYYEAADAQQKGVQKILESGLHKEAAKEAMRQNDIEGAVKLFDAYSKLKNVEINAAASKAKVAIQALKAAGKNGEAKLLENFLKNVDKIAMLPDERREPMMNALSALIEKAMSGKITFDVDELTKARDAMGSDEE